MWRSGPTNSITDVAGILVGHAHDLEGLTGVTAVLTTAGAGAVVGVAVEGSAPGTRETDLCRSGTLVTHAHAVLLCGGSAFGLAAADGAMRYLDERGIGFPTSNGPVPIVPAAVLYDLGVGSSRSRPDSAMGYAACASASSGPVPQGCVGAGAGCSAGKLLGIAHATKTGIGSASIMVGEIVVGALIAVNPFGDIWSNGRIIAGTRNPDGSGYLDTTAAMLNRPTNPSARAGEQTTIGVVAVGGRLTKEEANKVARMAHDGLARSIQPIHTMFDGDTLFCLATGDQVGNVSAIGAAAAIAVELAVVQAVRQSISLGGLPNSE